jgi:TPR repeat protein
LDSAYHLLIRANELDSSLGLVYYNLGWLFEFGNSKYRNKATAIRYYRDAAAKGEQLAKDALKRLEQPHYLFLKNFSVAILVLKV